MIVGGIRHVRGSSVILSSSLKRHYYEQICKVCTCTNILTSYVVQYISLFPNMEVANNNYNLVSLKFVPMP